MEDSSRAVESSWFFYHILPENVFYNNIVVVGIAWQVLPRDDHRQSGANSQAKCHDQWKLASSFDFPSTAFPPKLF